MRRSTGFGLGLIAALALTACGGGEVAIIVELEGEDGGDARLLGDVEIRLLPFDRDRIFDSLTAAAPVPEPVMPAELVLARDEISELQRAWRAEEDRVATLREDITRLDGQLQGLNRAMNEYKRIYEQLAPMHDELPRAEAQARDLFGQFNTMQQANIEQLDAFKIEQENWADQAFRDVPDIFAALTDMSGRDQHWDTTGAGGEAQIDELAPGQYWVYARYELVYDELYWNVPVAVERGDPVVVRLNRANAVLRPIL